MAKVLNSLTFNLKRLRKLKGLTQEGLAEAAGLSREYLAQLETGKTWAGQDTLESLLNALNCSPNDLFLDPNYKPDPRDAWLAIGEALGLSAPKQIKPPSPLEAEVLSLLSKIDENHILTLIGGLKEYIRGKGSVDGADARNATNSTGPTKKKTSL